MAHDEESNNPELAREGYRQLRHNEREVAMCDQREVTTHDEREVVTSGEGVVAE